jgi:transposase InsO family protein
MSPRPSGCVPRRPPDRTRSESLVAIKTFTQRCRATGDTRFLKPGRISTWRSPDQRLLDCCGRCCAGWRALPWHRRAGTVIDALDLAAPRRSASR